MHAPRRQLAAVLGAVLDAFRPAPPDQAASAPEEDAALHAAAAAALRAGNNTCALQLHALRFLARALAAEGAAALGTLRALGLWDLAYGPPLFFLGQRQVRGLR